MHYGPYRLDSPLGAGPAGANFRAVADDGTVCEVRCLSRVCKNPVAWAALARRLKLIALLQHPSHLQPIATDLDHDPPYIVVPPTRPADRPDSSLTLECAADLTCLLAAAHRLGLSLGQPVLRTAMRSTNAANDQVGPHVVHTTEDRLVLDLTGTGGDGAEFAADSDPADDVARLGQLFHEALLPPAGSADDWHAIIAMMRAANPADRPLASAVAEWFDAGKLDATHASNSEHGLIRTPRESIAGELAYDESVPHEVLQPGDVIGRFVLLNELGQGGVGVVYRAEDRADGTIVALKVLRPEVADSDTVRRRFVKEARLLAALDTPYVTRLIEANADGDRCYLAIEFVAGQSLGRVLRDAGRLDEADGLAVIADAARGLAAAHALGIVHRDVKPDNLLLCAPGGSGPRVKVTDFGLARPIVQQASLEVTQAGSLIGTPLYMAPEQFGTAPIDQRADVYALGATLFHLLGGRAPFLADTLPALARLISTEPPPPLDRVNPAITAPTAALVARCLSKDPAARPVDAGAFLREVEKIRLGEPTDLTVHPRMPAGAHRAIEYVHTWDLAAAPARLWPYISNTERLNRAVGLPAPRYEFRHDADLGTRRFATARVVGFHMEWEEHPYEWVEGRRLGVLREYLRGPFNWFLSIVELLPGPNGGTTIRHTLRAQPRGLIGRIAAPIELGFKARRSLGGVYRRIDEVLASQSGSESPADPFERAIRLPRSGQRRLEAGIARLRAAGVAPTTAEAFEQYLADAPAQEAARIRPLALARRCGIDESAMAEACLRAVGAGLLELKWDIICPLCRIPAGQRDTLRELREHESCSACAAEFRADFADAVELVFRVHPEVRSSELGTYCAGGPVHSPHVVAQTRLAAGERVELDLALSEGLYRLRGSQLPWTLELRIVPGAGVRRWEVDLGAASREAAPPLGAGGQVLVLQNSRPHELVARVERAAARDDALTAARATALPAFRELFPGELLSPGQLAPASTVTLLHVQIADGEDLFDRLGEGQAFQLLQAALRAIGERVRTEGGAIVKSVGEGVVAAFSEVTAGVRAALAIAEDLAADPVAAGLRLRMALHRGLALVATVNDRLDYFGNTAKLAERLLDSAKGGELILSAAAADDHDVAALFGRRRVGLVEVAREGRAPVLAYRVPLAPEL